MQVEIKRVQRETGITAIFVTHDQGEALAMSDRIAVMNEGRIEQLAAPQEIYEAPLTAFVADFVGKSNLLPASAAASQGGEDSVVAIRPEHIRLERPPSSAERSMDGTVESVQYLGTHHLVGIRTTGGEEIIAHDNKPWSIGDAVAVSWPMEKGRLVPRARATRS